MAALVQPPARGEHRVSRDVLVAALADDPSWTHVLPDREDRELALRCLTGVALADAGPHARVAVVDGRVVGAAVWQPPGRYPMSGWRQARAVPRMLPLVLRRPRAARAIQRLGEAVDAFFPAEPVRYLQVLGVAPGAQGRGVGATLLAEGLTDGDAAYLETGKPENVAYYERHGFVLVAPGAPLYRGGPPMWRMRRPARTGGAQDP